MLAPGQRAQYLDVNQPDVAWDQASAPSAIRICDSPVAYRLSILGRTPFLSELTGACSPKRFTEKQIPRLRLGLTGIELIPIRYRTDPAAIAVSARVVIPENENARPKPGVSIHNGCVPVSRHNSDRHRPARFLLGCGGLLLARGFGDVRGDLHRCGACVVFAEPGVDRAFDAVAAVEHE